MSDEVTANILEVGNIVIDGKTIERGAVIQFYEVEDLKRAIAAGARVRLEWRVDEVPASSEDGR